MQNAAPAPPAFDRACQLLAAAIPLLVSVWRSSPIPQWRDDLSVARVFGLAPVGLEGNVSAALGMVSALLPFGGRLMRAACVSAVAAAVAGFVTYVLARRLLETAREGREQSRLLAPALALGAALTATLCREWQLEATVAGGSSVAAALLLCALCVAAGDLRRAANWWVLGILGAALLLENPVAAVVLAFCLTGIAVSTTVLPSRRHLSCALFAFGLTAALLFTPNLLSPERLTELGDSLLQLSQSAGLGRSETPAYGPWLSNLGVVAPLGAVFGGVWGLLLWRCRPIAVALLVPVLADLLWPGETSPLMTAPLSVIRLTALSALSVLSALAVQGAVNLLLSLRLPLGRQAALLLVVFNLTFVFVAVEDSSSVAELRMQSGAEAWTDEAFANLPPNSLLLLRSAPVAWRLWSARALRGERPDVILASLEQLDDPARASELIRVEPALVPLVRELAIFGRPSEFALCTLSDTRPLFVEYNQAFEDRRLLEHLLPHAFWLEFLPHALGRSDRVGQASAARDAFGRVLDSLDAGSQRDTGTLAVMERQLVTQAVTLAALGDRQTALRLTEQLEKLNPAHPVAARLKADLQASDRSPIDLTALLL